MSHTPSPEFQNAAAYLSNAPSLKKVSNNVKLELYGLFKLVTVSPNPNTSRPSLLDFAGRAKWDAWKAAGQRYDAGYARAETRYLEIARELGWAEGDASVSAGSGGTDTAEIEDAERVDEGAGRGESGGGLGNSVSTMAAWEGTEQRDAGSIHSLAMAGDVKGLEAFITAHPGSSLDQKDEYGYTALHLACDRGHPRMVEYLLDNGVDVSIKDEDELTAYELAQVAEHDEIIRLLESRR